MEGLSGAKRSGRNRTGMERLEAIESSIAQGDDFKSRVKDAEGDQIRLSDLMAEAIAMDRASRSLERVGKNGKITFSVERLMACHCMDAAREAYLRARGSNAT